ncbi:MAG TPA: hypothetical protein EYP85_03705, partial [Armatimonadetes bacterium]|nr:hypothetical protein [Armatimonadota bacterium]
DPRSPNVVYLCSDIGGIFKSTDYGDHWRIINQGLIEVSTHQSVAALALHPRDPNLIFAAVGCNFGRDQPQPPEGHGGVLRSTDGGESWEVLSEQIRFCGHGLTRQEGNVLVINPQHPEVMLAGTAYEGVFKSLDGGRTWAYKGLANKFITTVALRPDNPEVVYVAAAKAYPGKPWESRGGLFRSLDGGETWKALLADLDVQALVINPQNPEVLYAACWDKGVYKSADGGETWEPVNNGLIPGHGNRRYKALAINPQNPDILYLTSSEQDYRPPVTRFTNLYRTTDGGRTWHKIPEDIWRDCSSAPGEYCYPGAVNWWGFFPSKNSIAVDPQNPDRVYYTSGFGLWRSEDGGKTWQAKSRGLETAPVRCILCDPTRPGVVYAGYGERGLFKSEDGGKTMRYCGSGTTGWPSSLALSRHDDGTTVLYLGGEGQVWKSKDEGKTWKRVLGQLARGKAVALAIDPADPETVYAVMRGKGGGLYKTTDAGAHWQFVALDLSQPSAIAVNPRHPATVYLRDWEKGVYRSEDGGLTWQPAKRGLPTSDHNFSPAPLALDPRDPVALYTGYLGGLFKSEDGGKSWRCVFPKTFVKAIAIAPTNSAVYVANSAHLWPGWWDEAAPPPGVYRSTDGGATWVPLSREGLMNFEMEALALDPFVPGRLYVGAGGNGLFVGEPQPGSSQGRNAALRRRFSIWRERSKRP